MDIIYEHTFYSKLTIKFDRFGCSTLYMNWIWTNNCTLVMTTLEVYHDTSMVFCQTLVHILELKIIFLTYRFNFGDFMNFFLV
jgi:hypothetical protein